MLHLLGRVLRPVCLTASILQCCVQALGQVEIRSRVEDIRALYRARGRRSRHRTEGSSQSVAWSLEQHEVGAWRCRGWRRVPAMRTWAGEMSPLGDKLQRAECVGI
jgi:hypothetical protein